MLFNILWSQKYSLAPFQRKLELLEVLTVHFSYYSLHFLTLKENHVVKDLPGLRGKLLFPKSCKLRFLPVFFLSISEQFKPSEVSCLALNLVIMGGGAVHL